MEMRDYLAFMLSDAILCPTPYSMESYKHWDKFDEILRNKPVYYCVTGAPKRPVRIKREILRQKLQIPQDAKVILYLGRKEKIKGYDLFVESAQFIVEKYKQIWFLVVGDGNLQDSVQHPHFIDIGFTSDVASYIQCADICVTTNRANYFDISMIEFLAEGKILLLSNIGGNKWLKNRINGVFYFNPEDAKDLISKIIHITSIPDEIILRMGEENLEFYNKNLTLYNFQDNYQKAIDKIRSDLGKDIFIRDRDQLDLDCIEISKSHEALNAFVRFTKDFINHKVTFRYY